MLWLYLLGLVTFLAIVDRRLLRRQKPLVDDLYAHRLVIDHVQDGVAWIRNGRIRYLNPSLLRILDYGPDQLPDEFKDRPWFHLFTPGERPRVEAAYSQMLLAGKASLEANLVDANGRAKFCVLLMVAVHDHKTRLVGHHCIVHEPVCESAGEERAILAVS